MAVVSTFPETEAGPSTTPIAAFITPPNPTIQETPTESDAGVDRESSPLSNIDTILPPPSNQLALVKAPVPAVQQTKDRKAKTGPARRSTRNTTGIIKDASSSAVSPDALVSGPAPALDTTLVAPSATKKHGCPPKEIRTQEEARRKPNPRKRRRRTNLIHIHRSSLRFN
ncbi:hypothetical protein BDP27DRAFT_1412362 [Rhodocollybia butyracea]|uniref:Uncharacterized protein n=1 Tax=Rhodocollybia butyracea TaxID=206335 RepID=A0A9P5UH16_9AGAR|nr:hypothetical protein BDP27DRAFT_1412362 [Rhodocollybia butyracea]